MGTKSFAKKNPVPPPLVSSNARTATELGCQQPRIRVISKGIVSQESNVPKSNIDAFQYRGS